jgi:DNA modification methylase
MITGRAVVIRGDAGSLPLPDGCVDLIVTSPPYFGLRDYRDGGGSLEGQIGSEATPHDYLAALWDCTREWMRVLKPSGSIFVNCGDKYAGAPSGPRTRPPAGGSMRRMGAGNVKSWAERRAYDAGMTREKSLLGLPWRYAIGCVDRLGLILRAEIIWQKPNGLPESVQDRVRRSHEQVFHLVKQPRYYAAVDEIREPQTTQRIDGLPTRHANGAPFQGHRSNQPGNALGKLPGSVWSIPSSPLTVPAHLGVDHFAAYPAALVRPIVLGWSPPGVCAACGQGRRPVVDKRLTEVPGSGGIETGLRGTRDLTEPAGNMRGWNGAGYAKGATAAIITGYACGCPTPDAPTRPAIVLDPFAGTGTSMLVASVLGRIGVGVDRSMDYARLAQWRVSDPGERARALDVPKPPPVLDGQESLFDPMGSDAT